MVSLKEVLRNCVEILKPNIPSPLMEAEIILGFVLKKDTIQLKIHRDSIVSSEDAETSYSLCKRRVHGEPIAYITGVKEFMSLEFEVNKNVLIPRSDTETIVEYIIQKYENKNVDILDLCTGSGAICCSLAHYIPGAVLTGTDVSYDALQIAKRNSKKLSVDNKTSFILKDALSDYDFKDKFDVVVSNPPYIETHILPTLMKDVIDFEPTLALDGGCDGLIFYKTIVNNIRRVLKKGGELVFEIGYNQGEALVEIMKRDFENISVTKDLGGNPRMVTGQLI